MLGLLLVGGALFPSTTSASPSLALPRHDYPQASAITALPATNALADRYLRPAHHSTFQRLRRLDGLGWLQFATWHFTTGSGGLAQRHDTQFGYGINVFRDARAARKALRDVKLHTRPLRVAKLPARAFRSSDVRQTLVFAFFAYRSVEVEAYYEYSGVAPAAIATLLHDKFATQRSHLVHLARMLSRVARSTPTPTPPDAPLLTDAPAPSDTPTATPTSSPTSMPTASPPTSTPAPPTDTPTTVPTATPTPTPVMVTATATMESSTYAPGQPATVDVRITVNGQPARDGAIEVSFHFPSGGKGCTATVDASGLARCSAPVPSEPAGTRVDVSVLATAAGKTATADAYFNVAAG